MSLFADDIIEYIENHKDFKTRLDLIDEFSKVAGCKITYKNQQHFCTLTMNYLKKNKEIHPIYNSIKNNKVRRNKFNQG